MVQTNLLRQISETAPKNAPSLVFSQIPSADVDRFDTLLKGAGIDIETPETFRRAPLILSRVTTLKGQVPVAEDIPKSERWIIEAEVALTLVGKKPPEAEIVEGQWWADDYRGPLLTSVEVQAAKALGLSIGDRVGFKVFGRDVEATVASFRKVDWGGFGVNTAFIVSPGTLEAANPRHFAIATWQARFCAGGYLSGRPVFPGSGHADRPGMPTTR